MTVRRFGPGGKRLVFGEVWNEEKPIQALSVIFDPQLPQPSGGSWWVGLLPTEFYEEVKRRFVPFETTPETRAEWRRGK